LNSHYRSQTSVACRSRRNSVYNLKRTMAALACYKNLFFGSTNITTGIKETNCQKTIFYSVVETLCKKEMQ